MKISLLAAMFVLSALTTPVRAQDPVEHGRALVQEFCAECHAIGAQDESPDKEAPPLRDISRSFDLDTLLRELVRGISSNHPDMPQVKFSPQDARDVRAYLRTIQK